MEICIQLELPQHHEAIGRWCFGGSGSGSSTLTWMSASWSSSSSGCWVWVGVGIGRSVSSAGSLDFFTFGLAGIFVIGDLIENDRGRLPSATTYTATGWRVVSDRSPSSQQVIVDAWRAVGDRTATNRSFIANLLEIKRRLTTACNHCNQSETRRSPVVHLQNRRGDFVGATSTTSLRPICSDSL